LIEIRYNPIGLCSAFKEPDLVVFGTKGVDKAVKLTNGVKVVEEAGGVRVFDGIDAIIKKTNCYPTDLNNYLQKIDKDLAENYADDLIIQKGNIAPGFGSTGGGIQYEMPIPVDLLEGLGLIEKMK
jgi:hypothetical protein